MLERIERLVGDVDPCRTAVAGGVVIPYDHDRAKSLLRAKIAAALFEVIIEEVAEQRRPRVIHHPVNGHLTVRPVDGVSFHLSADVLKAGELGFPRKFLHAAGRAVAFAENAPDVLQDIVAVVTTGVEEPRFVDRPEFVGRNKLLETFHRRNGFVVAFLRGGTARGWVLVAKPEVGRTPDVGTNHLNTVPGSVSGGNGIEYAVLPMGLFENLRIVAEDGIERQAVASVGPENDRWMRAQFTNAGA